MAQRRFNNKNFTDIGSILDRVLHQYRPKTDQELCQVWDLWDIAVGAEIAANAKPAAFKGRRLLVYVSNSSWLHHLRFMEKDLIAKINGALGAERIETIQLKIGPIWSVANVTHDTFFNGQLRIAQPGSGYRYSIDAVLLAALPRMKPGQSLLDLGTGCGIIPLILGFRNREVRITGVEVQSELARLAEMNVANNGLQDRIRIIHEDLRRLSTAMVSGPVDWIVSNPPYRRAVSGRINPDTQRALARHEIKVNLHELINTAKRLLKTGGRFAIIYPSERSVDLFSEMRLAGLEPKWLQCVHSQADGDAKLVLVQAVMGGKPGLKIDSPLVVYGSDGGYSAAVQDMMAS